MKFRKSKLKRRFSEVRKRASGGERIVTEWDYSRMMAATEIQHAGEGSREESFIF